MLIPTSFRIRVTTSAVLVFFQCFMFAACSGRMNKMFTKKSETHTGITFSNDIVETDSINPLDLEFLYNGGGVAVADFNNDGLSDLYFTGSTVSNELYLNKGNLKFRNVTKEAGVNGDNRWANAASVVDINNDGWSDLYISNSIWPEGLRRKNILYINQGVVDNGVPRFVDMAEAYGLADTSFSVHAAFMDYDRDGDLDMYLLTTKLAKRDGVRFFASSNTGDTSTTDIDRLYRNDWNNALGHPVFTDVSAAAGIVHPGFGLGVAVTDIDRDGWPDIYVTNDFFGSDVLYLNNRDGTFTNRIADCMRHTSQNAMGNDAADINNDGLIDIIAVDMNPEDNFRKKKNMNGGNYNIYQNMTSGGYSLQYVRNTLQLNMGAAIHENDSVGPPVFADIAFLAGVAETDWSWSPLMADFDNDGYRDIMITNGYPRDVTDHDFAAYRGRAGNMATKQDLINQMPSIKIGNYAFRNNGDLTFTNTSKEWGMPERSFSNGSVYADLDNDGDLDYVINNINEPAFVYENRVLNARDSARVHFITVAFKGPTANRQGIGAVAELYYDGKYQFAENYPFRGYLSCVSPVLHFGIGNAAKIDSLLITWPDGRTTRVIRPAIDRQLVIDYADSNTKTTAGGAVASLFENVTRAANITHVHREMDYIDFNEQRLLPHKLSQLGPGLAAGDIDGNGLDDLFIGGTGDHRGKFFLQQKDGKFLIQDLPKAVGKDPRNPENMGVLFFDADNDLDTDVFFANGSNEFAKNSKSYEDGLLVNDGNGQFRWDTSALPVNRASKSCVRAADFDNDGDLDLFIGSRVTPGNYPQPPASFIYRNDSSPGAIKFTDVTSQVAPALINIGMVCDALWTDINNDGHRDLIIAGEWMPVTVFINENGILKNITAKTGIANMVGWWNSITPGDFDNDGDIDYIAGNLGLNSYFRASPEHPVSLYSKDFDGNQTADIVPTLYLPNGKGKREEYPAHTRDEIVEQLPGLKKRFLTYREFGSANIHDIFGNELENALTRRANYFSSSYIENLGGGRFRITALPNLFQISPLFGIVAQDVNADGNLDIIVCGNDYGNEVSNGRYDALTGIVGMGNGSGGFTPKMPQATGFFLPGDGKALIKLRGSNGRLLVAGSQNRSSLDLFRLRTSAGFFTVDKDDDHAIVSLRNGKHRREEFHFGAGYLSQSSRIIAHDSSVSTIAIINKSGLKRKFYESPQPVTR